MGSIPFPKNTCETRTFLLRKRRGPNWVIMGRNLFPNYAHIVPQTPAGETRKFIEISPMSIEATRLTAHTQDIAPVFVTTSFETTHGRNIDGPALLVKKV